MDWFPIFSSTSSSCIFLSFFSCKTQWCSKVKTLDNFFFWQCGYVRSLITSIDFIWYLIFDWYNCRFFLPSPYSVTEPKSEQKKFQGDSDSIVYAMHAICILIEATCVCVCGICVKKLMSVLPPTHTANSNRKCPLQGHSPSWLPSFLSIGTTWNRTFKQVLISLVKWIKLNEIDTLEFYTIFFFNLMLLKTIDRMIQVIVLFFIYL